MTPDLAQYADIIETLKPMVNRPDFNRVLDEIANHIPKEKRFLIKMELKRLSKPCLRSIDLRGRVSGECRLFEYDGVKHYLDDAAHTQFKKQLDIFGKYCFAVYEAVTQREGTLSSTIATSFAPTIELPKAPVVENILEKYDLTAINLLNYAQRQHERMNFAITLEITDRERKSVTCTSVDISAKGLRVKSAKPLPFELNDRMFVFFRGLENQYTLDKSKGVAYTLLKREEQKGHVYSQLVRDEQIPDTGFDNFIEEFINTNKRRYKVNLNNTIEAIASKTLEQYFSPTSPSLPVFMECNEEVLVSHYAMANDLNRDIIDYWSDETNRLCIGYMLSPGRVRQLLASSEPQPTLYCYAFTHQKNGKLYYYSATNTELSSDDALRRVYLGFGARKASWRVFKLIATTMVPEQAHVPLSIPDSLGSKVKRQNLPPSPRLMGRLKALNTVIHVVDVTSNEGQASYANNNFNRAELTLLKRFAHPKNRPPEDIKTFRYRYQEQRLETRYMLRTPVRVTGVNGSMSYEGVSEDVSVHGLRIEIAGEYFGDVGELVDLTFIKLQEMTTSYDLRNLRYEIVNLNKENNILHLRTIEGDKGEQARTFFDMLIKENKSTLKQYPDQEEIPGIGHALRMINARNTPLIACVMGKEGAQYVPEASIIDVRNKRLLHLLKHFAQPNHINIEFLFRDRALDSPFIQTAIKHAKVDCNAISNEVYIAFDTSQTVYHKAIVPRYQHRFLSDSDRADFIKNAREKGEFLALKIVVTTTGKPDLEMVQTELAYVGMYAIHRAKELEEKLWRISANVFIVDITEDVLFRHSLS